MLDPIDDQAVVEGQAIVVQAAATDADLPANQLTFSLDSGAPVGATIDPVTGRFDWMTQLPGTYEVTVRVTDDGLPALSDLKTFSITVALGNHAPLLESIADRTVDEGQTLTVDVIADDEDPDDVLSFALEPGMPEGATIDSATGRFTWTTAEAHGPADYDVTVRVTDNGSPSKSDTTTFRIAVAEINQAPVLDSIDDRTAHIGQTLSVTAMAANPDLPANTLYYSLDLGAPVGATIDPASGELIWSLSAGAVPGWYEMTVRVIDSSSPRLGDAVTFRTLLLATAPGGQIDWGEVDYLEIPAAQVVDGDRYVLRPMRNGLLTIEAVFARAAGDIDLTLFDAEGRQIAASTAGTDGARIDTTVVAGQQLELRIGGSNPSVAYRVANLVSEASGRTTLHGTTGDDTFTIGLGTSHSVTINAVSYQLDSASSPTLVVEGGGGSDGLSAIGTTAAETVVLRPGSAELVGPLYGVEVVDVAQINIAGGGGTDIATFYDSPGDDEFVGTPTYARLEGDGFFNEVESFAEVHAYSDAGGLDVAKLFDSTSNDTYVGTPIYGALSGATYFNEAIHFDGTHAYATSGGLDIARLFDSDGDDTFYGDPSEGSLYGDGYYNRAKFFDAVHAYGTGGAGHDVATLYDSAGDDTFFADPTEASLYGDGFYNRAKLFDEAFGHATAGGNDSALLVDSQQIDSLEAAEDWARLFNVDSPFRNWAGGFGSVTARSNHGPDLKNIDAAVDFLILEGVWNDV